MRKTAITILTIATLSLAFVTGCESEAGTGALLGSVGGGVMAIFMFAAALAISEDAAKKRLSVALEKLRKFLRRKGIVVPVAMMATLLPRVFGISLRLI